ncbi:MAG: hypothetical protein ACRCXZ_05285 [Patescibacteria group bacterium]
MKNLLSRKLFRILSILTLFITVICIIPTNASPYLVSESKYLEVAQTGLPDEESPAFKKAQEEAIKKGVEDGSIKKEQLDAQTLEKISATPAQTNPVVDGIGKVLMFILSLLLAIFVIILWILTRFLAMLFKFLGGVMYGFFVINPLDNNIDSIRPLWSFLVDFGNLIVVGSFLALAVVYLFNLKPRGISTDISKFGVGILVLAILLNFSLTLTSGIVSTIHNVGIGAVYLTTSPGADGLKLNLNSRSEFNSSLTKAGGQFFNSVSNNFVEQVSCLGEGTAQVGNSVKSMREICVYHKTDTNSNINPLMLLTSLEGSDGALNFYLTAIIRELAVIILLGIAVFTVVKLLKVAAFRLAYLWLVGIFAGPALVAFLSPFDSLKKYSQIWLKWAISFSTMTLVFVFGFYLSAYIAQLNFPNPSAEFTPVPNGFTEPNLFISVITNNLIQLVMPAITFPIIGVTILYLLGKYLDEIYQSQAESAMKMGGKMIGEGIKGTRAAIAMPGKAMGAVGKTLGAASAVRTLPTRLRSNTRGAAGNVAMAAAGAASMLGAKNAAQRLEATAMSQFGRAAVNQQRTQSRMNEAKKLSTFDAEGRKRAKGQAEYLSKMGNLEMIKALGGNEADIIADARKAGVSEEVLQKGKMLGNKFYSESNDGDGDFVTKAAVDNKVKNSAFNKLKRDRGYSQKFQDSKDKLSQNQNKIKDNEVTRFKTESGVIEQRKKDENEVLETDIYSLLKQYEVQDTSVENDEEYNARIIREKTDIIKNLGTRIQNLTRDVKSGKDAGRDVSAEEIELNKYRQLQKDVKSKSDKQNSNENRALKETQKLKSEHDQLMNTLESTIDEIDNADENDINTPVAAALIADFEKQNPDIRRDELNAAYSKKKGKMNSSTKVVERRKKAEQEAISIEATAQSLVEQMEAIDKQTGIDKKQKDRLKAALLESASMGNTPEQNEAVKRANEKYKKKNTKNYDL